MYTSNNWDAELFRIVKRLDLVAELFRIVKRLDLAESKSTFRDSIHSLCDYNGWRLS